MDSLTAWEINNNKLRADQNHGMEKSWGPVVGRKMYAVSAADEASLGESNTDFHLQSRLWGKGTQRGSLGGEGCSIRKKVTNMEPRVSAFRQTSLTGTY